MDNALPHPILDGIRDQGFTALGWFQPASADRVPHGAKFMVLIGNAGPEMFRRFELERDSAGALLDDWTRKTVDRLAATIDARAIYPFDKPALPFLTWGRHAGAGHVSPLGLNIHPVYGLWHAYRAALLFPAPIDLPAVTAGSHPCEGCVAKPCLHACPICAFDGLSYDVASCAQFISGDAGQLCMTGGCQARRACPVGRDFAYRPEQIQFHMRAFRPGPGD